MWRGGTKREGRKARAGKTDAGSTAKLQARRERGLWVAENVGRFVLARGGRGGKAKKQNKALPSGYQKPARRAPRYPEKNPAKIFPLDMAYGETDVRSFRV